MIITGGEASIHPNFMELCEYLKGNRKRLKNIKKLVLQTNGNIEKYKLDILTGFDFIHLSFDIDKNEYRRV